MTNYDVLTGVGGAPAPSTSIPFDLSKGQPVLVLPVDDTEVITTMPVSQLLALVPDPRKAENPREVANDPVVAAYAGLRKETQRIVQGAKARNAVAFARYIVEGVRRERPIMLPAVTLYYPSKLETIQLPNGQYVLMLPYGAFLVAIDGETQRIGLQLAAQEEPAVLALRVKAVLHHGKPVEHARQGFYDLNVREVKPNAAVAIAMDTQDPATRITRRVMEECPVLEGGAAVNLMRRQLRRSDSELVTISGLRTGIVTTILGTSGLQVGSKPIDRDDLRGADERELGDSVVDVWNAILEELEGEFAPDRRAESVVSAPAILAGLGVLAHHAIPSPPRRDGVAGWTADDVVEHLGSIDWNRVTGNGTDSPWDGIAGKFTPSGRFSIGGPKEVGYAVVEALETPDSTAGQQIRRSREA